MGSEKVVKLAAKLYEARDSFKALWGAKWREKLVPYDGALTAARYKWKCDEMAAAMRIVKDLQTNVPNSHGGQMGILAALVEALEPTPREENADAPL